MVLRGVKAIEKLKDRFNKLRLHTNKGISE
jgi:hypothetical protein